MNQLHKMQSVSKQNSPLRVPERLPSPSFTRVPTTQTGPQRAFLVPALPRLPLPVLRAGCGCSTLASSCPTPAHGLRLRSLSPLHTCAIGRHTHSSGDTTPVLEGKARESRAVTPPGELAEKESRTCTRSSDSVLRPGAGGLHVTTAVKPFQVLSARKDTPSAQRGPTEPCGGSMQGLPPPALSAPLSTSVLHPQDRVPQL